LGVILSIGQNNTHSEKPPFAAVFAAKLPSIEMRSRKGLQFAMAPADLSTVIDRPSYGELFYTVSSSELY